MKHVSKLLLLSILLFVSNFVCAENLDQNIKKMGESMTMGNLYDYAHIIAVENEKLSIYQSFDNASKFINKTYSCGTSSSDIYNVYMNLQDGSVFGQWSELNGKKTSQSGNFIDSCMKIVKCIDKGSYLQKKTATKDIQYSKAAFDTCTATVQQSVTSAKSPISNYNTAKVINYADDVFVNGKDGDAPYDLMVDVLEIGKIIFKGMAQANKAVFYQGDSSSSSSSSSDMPPNMSLSNLFKNSGSSSDSQKIIDAQNAINTQAAINNFINSSRSQSTSSSQSISQSMQEILDSSDMGGIVNSTSCPFDNTGVDTGLQDLAYISSNGDYFDYSGYYDLGQGTRLMDSFNLSNIKTSLFNGKPDYLGFGNYSSAFALPDSFYGGGGGGSSDFTLGNGGPGCAGFGDSNSIISIKFCMVSTKDGGANAGGKKSGGGGNGDTIEDIVDKLWELVKETRNKGASMKHAYTDERWETSLKDIKLKDIFSFDFQLKFKPIFDSSNKDNKKKKDEQEQKQMNKDAERKYAGISNVKNDKLDRNKYRVLRGAKQEAQKSLSVDMNTYSNMETTASLFSDEITPNPEGKEANEQKKTQNKIAEEYKKFIEGNDKMWSAMADALANLSASSAAMKNKVKN